MNLAQLCVEPCKWWTKYREVFNGSTLALGQHCIIWYMLVEIWIIVTKFMLN